MEKGKEHEIKDYAFIWIWITNFLNLEWLGGFFEIIFQELCSLSFELCKIQKKILRVFLKMIEVFFLIFLILILFRLMLLFQDYFIRFCLLHLVLDRLIESFTGQVWYYCLIFRSSGVKETCCFQCYCLQRFEWINYQKGLRKQRQFI